MFAHCADERLLYLGSRIVGVVEYAELRVAAFAMKVEFSFLVLVELHSPVYELLYLRGGLTHHLFNCRAVAYVVAGNHRVLDVLLEVVYQQVGNRCYTSLCKIGIGILKCRFTYKGNCSLVRHLQGEAHSGNTGTDNQKVEFPDHINALLRDFLFMRR